MSEVSIFSSGIASISTRRSLDIGIKKFPFIPGCFARADDPRCAVPVGMDDTDYYKTADKAVAALSRFAVVPLVFHREDRSLEYGAGLFKS